MPPARIQTTLESALVCPLISGNAVIGTLAVYHTVEAFYCDDHRRLLDRVCEQASAVIRNAIVFDQTHEASLTDPLTGLPNTRFMFRHLTRELARTQRLGAEVSLLVLDLNGFKDINDTYGHHAGDRALREVVQRAPRAGPAVRRLRALRRATNSSSCWPAAAVRRPRTSAASCSRASNRSCSSRMPGRPVPLSISVGAAVFPHDGDTYESLLADRGPADVSGQERAQARCTPAARCRAPEVTPATDYEITAV